MSELAPETAAELPPSGTYTRRSATYIGSLTLTAKVAERLAAFAQIALIASIYGASTRSDLYFIASILPLTLGTVVGEALATTALPALVKRQQQPGFERFLSASFWSALAVLAACVAGYLAVVIVVVEKAAPAGSSSLAPWLAFSPTIVTLGLSAYFGAVLLLFERYTWPPFRAAAATVAGLLLTVLALLFTRDLVWIALAMTGGYALAMLLLAGDVRRGYGFSFLRAADRTAFREVAATRGNIAVALTGGVVGGQSFVLVERALAASLGVGAVSTISYARGIVFTPNILGQAISMGLYPGMVRAYESGDLAFVRGAFLRGLRLTLLVSGAGIAFFALFGDAVVRTLLERGAFSASAATGAAHALIAFSPAVAGTMLLILSSRAFYAIDFFRGIVWSQLAVLVPYVPLAFVLRSRWGTDGLAAAFAVAELVGGLVGIVLAGRLMKLTREDARSLVDLVRSLAIVAVVVVCARVAVDALPLGGAVDALVSAAIGAIAAAAATVGVLLLGRWPEVATLRSRLLSLWNHGRSRFART